MSWCIGFYSKFFFSFQKSEDQLTCYLFFQLFKCFLLFFFPFPFFLAFEFVKRFCHMTKVLDKPSIEICKLQKAFHFFYLGRGFPFLDCLNFIGFHLYLSSPNNYSQNRDFFYVEIAFRLFKTEIMFFCDFEKSDCPFFKFLHILCWYHKVVYGIF